MTHAAPDPELRPEDLTRVVLRPLATPIPLGVLALATGSILLTALQLGWLSMTDSHEVALVVLVLVVPLELIAAVTAFLIRDVVMATGLSILTGAWAASSVLLLTAPTSGGADPVFGTLAIAVAVAIVVPAVAAAPAKPAASILLIVAGLRFFLTGIYEVGAGDTWATASGAVGVLLVVTSLYSSVAFALEDARHHSVLPLSRRSTSAAAMSGDIGDQLESLATEAGVRQES